MKKLIRFGEVVDGYSIPVLNEREIRAAAGIMFLILSIAFMLIIFKEDFLPVKIIIIAFLTDFFIRVFINPKFSPSLIIGRLFVRNQVPEYVGARQKKFSWTIGFILSAIMFTLLVVVNAHSPITGIGCLVCLVFLFFEAAFGICLGCKVYSIIYGNKAQYCPGEVCDKLSKQDIQQISGAQVVVIITFIAFIFVTSLLFRNQFSKQPYDLFGINSSRSSK